MKASGLARQIYLTRPFNQKIKSHILLCDGCQIILTKRLLKILTCKLQIMDIIFCNSVTGKLDRQFLEGGTDFQYISQILLCNPCNLCTFSRDHHNKAFQLQLTNCFTDRCSADSLLVGQCNLPLRDVVFNTLRRAILKGELEPGERLMEIALANKLGVSRTPIREAIRKLELEGLL